MFFCETKLKKKKKKLLKSDLNSKDINSGNENQFKVTDLAITQKLMDGLCIRAKNTLN